VLAGVGGCLIKPKFHLLSPEVSTNEKWMTVLLSNLHGYENCGTDCIIFSSLKKVGYFCVIIGFS